MKIKPLKTLLLFKILALFYAQVALATTVAQLGTEELVNNAEYIFQGNVQSRSSELDPRGMIYTYVTFEVEDVLIDENQIGNSTLTLRFTGGSVGDRALDVGAVIPKVGERGIYFVEKVAFGLINPILGWEQGAFTINEDGTVQAGNNSPVLEIRRATSSQELQISNGIAAGVTTTSSQQTIYFSDSPMDLATFKKRILELRN